VSLTTAPNMLLTLLLPPEPSCCEICQQSTTPPTRQRQRHAIDEMKENECVSAGCCAHTG
jgi:hypothetical protein